MGQCRLWGALLSRLLLCPLRWGPRDCSWVMSTTVLARDAQSNNTSIPLLILGLFLWHPILTISTGLFDPIEPISSRGTGKILHGATTILCSKSAQ